jgi:hypothetical protein
MKMRFEKLNTIIDFTFESGDTFSAFESTLGETIIVHEHINGFCAAGEIIPEEFWKQIKDNKEILDSLNQDEFNIISRLVSLKGNDIVIRKKDLSRISKSVITYSMVFNFKMLEVAYCIDDKSIRCYDYECGRICLEEAEEIIRELIIKDVSTLELHRYFCKKCNGEFWSEYNAEEIKFSICPNYCSNQELKDMQV